MTTHLPDLYERRESCLLWIRWSRADSMRATTKEALQVIGSTLMGAYYELRQVDREIREAEATDATTFQRRGHIRADRNGSAVSAVD